MKKTRANGGSTAIYVAFFLLCYIFFKVTVIPKFKSEERDIALLNLASYFSYNLDYTSAVNRLA